MYLTEEGDPVLNPVLTTGFTKGTWIPAESSWNIIWQKDARCQTFFCDMFWNVTHVSGNCVWTCGNRWKALVSSIIPGVWAIQLSCAVSFPSLLLFSLQVTELYIEGLACRFLCFGLFFSLQNQTMFSPSSQLHSPQVQGRDMHQDIFLTFTRLLHPWSCGCFSFHPCQKSLHSVLYFWLSHLRSDAPPLQALLTWVARIAVCYWSTIRSTLALLVAPLNICLWCFIRLMTHLPVSSRCEPRSS